MKWCLHSHELVVIDNSNWNIGTKCLNYFGKKFITLLYYLSNYSSGFLLLNLIVRFLFWLKFMFSSNDKVASWQCRILFYLCVVLSCASSAVFCHNKMKISFITLGKQRLRTTTQTWIWVFEIKTSQQMRTRSHLEVVILHKCFTLYI